MAFLIGTDEAGYGPNLGPLVVTATVWHVPDDVLWDDLYPAVDRVIRSAAATSSDDDRVAIADSKLLYQPGGSLNNLERGVLSVLRACHSTVNRWRGVWSVLDENSESEMDVIPWYLDYDTSIPRDAAADEIERCASVLTKEFERSEIACRSIRSRAVFPQSFNRMMDEQGNKATVLADVTLSLVKACLDTIDNGAVLVHCDKLGGRNKYAPLLQHFFPDYLVEVRRESRAESAYRFGPATRRVVVRFVAKGESCIAAALASMTSKYLRELAMRPFNEFWRKHLPSIKPTAGYPVDAKRFRAEIADVQNKLGIPDHVLWRNR